MDIVATKDMYISRETITHFYGATSQNNSDHFWTAGATTAVITPILRLLSQCLTVQVHKFVPL